jgi:hypothetical protein
VIANAVIANAVIANAVIANGVIANAVIANAATVTEVILTEMTGTGTEEAIVIVVVILIRATVTREVDPLRLRLCSSLLSRHRPFVAGMTGTGIVVGMLGPGTPFQVRCQPT